MRAKSKFEINKSNTCEKEREKMLTPCCFTKKCNTNEYFWFEHYFLGERQGNNACPVLPPKEVENLAKEEHCYEQNLRKGFKITTNNNDKELWVKIYRI